VNKLAAIAVVFLASSTASWANGGERFPFHVGEKLTYQMFWGPFVVGRATLEVAGIEPVDGHDCYHLVAKAKTSGLAELLFPVDSTTESWMDVEGLFSRKYRQNRTEGKNHRYDETHFDYQAREVTVTRFDSGQKKTAPLDQPVQDIISSLYFVRTRLLTVGASHSFALSASERTHRVEIRPDQRKSLWVRPVGEVDAMRIEPHPTLQIVAANKGRMWFWVSDDSRHLPLVVTSTMQIGNAKLVLFKVESTHPGADRKAGIQKSPGLASRP
jgi:hypothetical protein